MDHEKQRQSSKDEETSLLKQRESFRHFMQECSECQQEEIRRIKA